MWSQDSSDSNSSIIGQSQFLISSPTDSGFISCSSELASMRACASDSSCTSDVETLIRDLSLKNASINNLETGRSMPPQQQHSIMAQRAERMNVRWSEIGSVDVLKQSYEFFYKQDCDGDTQLHISITMNLLEASLWLISVAPHPCLLDIANDDSMTALHLAVMNHEPQIVRRLILAGASTDIVNQAGNTALHLACALGDLACAKALTEPLSNLEKSWVSNNIRGQQLCLPRNLEIRNYVGQTSLHIAASKGHLELVNQLLRMGADVGAVEGLCGRSAIHLAIEANHRHVVHYLVQECRPCLEAVTYAGETPYQFAMETNKHQLVDDLLRLGALPVSSSESSGESSSDCNSSSEDERF